MTCSWFTLLVFDWLSFSCLSSSVCAHHSTLISPHLFPCSFMPFHFVAFLLSFLPAYCHLFSSRFLPCLFFRFCSCSCVSVMILFVSFRFCYFIVLSFLFWYFLSFYAIFWYVMFFWFRLHSVLDVCFCRFTSFLVGSYLFCSLFSSPL